MRGHREVGLQNDVFQFVDREGDSGAIAFDNKLRPGRIFAVRGTRRQRHGRVGGGRRIGRELHYLHAQLSFLCAYFWCAMCEAVCTCAWA